MAQDDFYRGDTTQGDEATYRPPPGYGPPPNYGPDSGYGYPPTGYHGVWRRPTNGLAIAALVMAFLFAPMGIVLGVVARKQIRHTGEEGDGLALAGVIVGAVATGFYVLIILFMVAAFSAATSYSY